MNIFGRKIKVLYGQINPNLNWDGFYDPETLTIAISENLKAKQKTQVLLHEFFHAIFDRLGYHQFLSKEQEELLCEQLSVALIENFSINLISGGNMAKKVKTKKPAKPMTKK